MTLDEAGDILLAIFRDKLAVEDIDLNSKFYALGGDSLIAVRVVNSARRRGVPISLQDLLVHQDVRSLVGSPELRKALAGGAGLSESTVPTPTVVPFSLVNEEDRRRVPPGVVDAAPASALQIGMIYLCEASQNPLLYRAMEGWEVLEPFDEKCFRSALRQLAARHCSLRTSFDLGAFSVPVQLVWDNVEPELRIEVAADAEEAANLAENSRRQHQSMPIGWQQPPLSRVHVVVLPDSFQVVLAAHHAILDGWSFNRLKVELTALYHGEAVSEPVILPTIPDSTQQDFLTAEREATASGAAERYWLDQADASPLLFDHKNPILGSLSDDRRVAALGHDLVTALTAVARVLNVSVKSVVLAAHLCALGAWTGRSKDIVTGVVFNTRPVSPGSDLATGLFLNTLPIRVPTLNTTWAALVTTVAEAERNGAQHHAFPQAALLQRLGRPAFDVVFNFMRFEADKELGELTSAQVQGSWRQGMPSFPFYVNVELSGRDAEIRIRFDRSVVSFAAAEVYERLFNEALNAIATSPVSPANLTTLLKEES
jgi:hypothetical protein